MDETKQSEAQELLAFAEELKQKRADLVGRLTASIEKSKAELRALGAIRVHRPRAKVGRPVGSKTKRREPAGEPKPEGTVGA